MVDIKIARNKDAEALAKIHTESWKDTYKNIIPKELLDKLSIETQTAYFKKQLFEGDEYYAIIFQDNNAVGFICFGNCRDVDLGNSLGEIWGLYLLPNYRNLGLGSKLLQWGIDELKKKGYSKVSLWVLESNLKAIKFYETHGFSYDGTIKKIYLGTPLDEWRYVKKL